MRIALISDIHGNLTALEAALAQIGRVGVDRIVCLGDVALDGPQPIAVIHRLRDLEIPVIKGNIDDWLLHPRRTAVRTKKARIQLEVSLWAAEQLTPTDKALIEDFAPTLSFDLDGLSLLCYHGSPRSFNDKIRPNTTTVQLAKYFRGHSATLLAGGHTHEAMVRGYGESVLINPGSIGMPRIHPQPGSEKGTYNPLWAEYALIESGAGGLSISLHRAPYPLADLTEAIHAAGMPHADYYLAGWR